MKHAAAAIKAGATKEESVDALGVAIMVNAGAAMVYSARTIDAYDAKTKRPVDRIGNGTRLEQPMEFARSVDRANCKRSHL